MKSKEWLMERSIDELLRLKALFEVENRHAQHYLVKRRREQVTTELSKRQMRNVEFMDRLDQEGD